MSDYEKCFKEKENEVHRDQFGFKNDIIGYYLIVNGFLVSNEKKKRWS